MKTKIWIVFILLGCFACKNNSDENRVTENKENESEMVFDKTKWKTKINLDYPYRDIMLNSLFVNDTLKKLKKQEVLNMLGKPDRIDSLYLFYRITQERISFFPLHTKTLVIKLSKDNTVKSVMIHE